MPGKRKSTLPMRSSLFVFVSLIMSRAVCVWAVPAAQAGAPLVPLRSAGEALCGPEIVLIGDAWEHVRLERDALSALLRGQDLVRVPQRTAALVSHLVFMQNRSLMVFGESKARLTAAFGRVLDLVPQLNALALTDQHALLKAGLTTLDHDLKVIGAQYPEEAVISSSATSFLLPPVVPSLIVRTEGPLELKAGELATIRFRLLDPKGQGLAPEGLHTTHTEKLHALVLDSQFRDYHHAHPQPAGPSGEYSFSFTPKTSGLYRMWVDSMPVATGRSEFPMANLSEFPKPMRKTPPPEKPVLTASSSEWTCQLILPQDRFVFGQPNVVSISLTDRNGQALNRLQPLMGAFAHIVGFADDFQTALHIHPLGAMPKAEELGGPKINFQLRPHLPGWLRLYVQFRVDGQDHLATFAAPVVVL